MINPKTLLILGILCFFFASTHANDGKEPIKITKKLKTKTESDADPIYVTVLGRRKQRDGAIDCVGRRRKCVDLEITSDQIQGAAKSIEVTPGSLPNEMSGKNATISIYDETGSNVEKVIKVDAFSLKEGAKEGEDNTIRISYSGETLLAQVNNISVRGELIVVRVVPPVGTNPGNTVVKCKGRKGTCIEGNQVVVERGFLFVPTNGNSNNVQIEASRSSKILIEGTKGTFKVGDKTLNATKFSIKDASSAESEELEISIQHK